MWLCSTPSTTSASMPILGLERDMGSLCTVVPDISSTLSLTVASDFRRPLSSIPSLALIPLFTSSACSTSLRGRNRPSPKSGSAVLWLRTTPVLWLGAESSVSRFSLNAVGYLTPLPLPMSPMRSECTGANTSTSSLELPLLVLLIIPPNLGTALAVDMLPLVKSATPLRLNMGLPLFQMRACAVLLPLSYASVQSHDGLMPNPRTGARLTSSPRSLPHQSTR